MERVKLSLIIIWLMSLEFCFAGDKCTFMCKQPQTQNVEQWNNVDIFIQYKKAIVTLPHIYEENELKKNVLRFPEVVMRSPPIPNNLMQNTEELIIGTTATYRVSSRDISNGCSTNFSTETKKILRKARCAPRPLLVHLLTEEAQFQVKPSDVLTKHCSGFCDERRRCEARTTVNKNVPVQIIPYSNKEQKLLCRTVSIPEDTKCKCVCIKKKKDCSPQQKYNRSFCECECTNKKEQEHCEKKSRITDMHMWDNKSCSCVCRNEIPCTTGTSWDSKFCRCSSNTGNG